MNGKQTAIMTGAILSILVLPSVSSSSSLALAYLPDQETTTGLDDLLRLSQERVRIVQENPGTGSGTPMFALDGVMGAIALSSGVFGGIAAAFFVKGRKGKYAMMGRG